jgi:hypothetical protein
MHSFTCLDGTGRTRTTLCELSLIRTTLSQARWFSVSPDLTTQTSEASIEMRTESPNT